MSQSSATVSPSARASGGFILLIAALLAAWWWLVNAWRLTVAWHLFGRSSVADGFDFVLGVLIGGLILSVAAMAFVQTIRGVKRM